MHPRMIRLLTTMAIVGVCVWPVWKGYEVIRYSLSDRSPEAVQPWIGVPGLAFFARQDALTSIDDDSDDKTIRKRRDELVEILTVNPLSSDYWLQLAEARIDDHEPLAKALDDLEMSEVTGPNEEGMITQRGLFGIWQWEVLPPEIQQRTIADLVAGSLSDSKLAWLKTTLAGKTDQVRQQIQSALQAQGLKKSNFERIGLSAE
jgi:hypothetical protein